MPVAYNMACEAPCDFGWVIALETLLRPASSFEDARKEDVDERQRLEKILAHLKLIIVDGTYRYCEAFLDVRMEGFARTLSCWRSILINQMNCSYAINSN